MTSCLPTRREEVVAPPPDRPLHHPRPGIYNAVLRSDLWALPALGTGHRLGIQNAPAGGPSQIRSDQISEKTARGKLRGLSNPWPLCVSRDLERRPPAGRGPKSIAFLLAGVVLFKFFWRARVIHNWEAPSIVH